MNFLNFFLALSDQKSTLSNLSFTKILNPNVKRVERIVPNNLRDRVNSESKKLLEEGHIEKLNNCSDQYFISPIVITVKRDQTRKLALDF